MSVHSLTDKVAIQFASRVVVQVLQILDGILLARWLSANDMATFGQVFLVAALLMPLFGNMGGGIAYFLPRLDRARQKGLLYQSITIGVIAGLLASCVVLGAAGPVGQRFNNPQLPTLLMVFCVFPLLTFPAYFFGQFTICAGRNVTGAVVSGVGKIVHSGVIFFCLLFNAPLVVMLISFLVYQAALTLFSIGYAAIFFRGVRVDWDRALLRSQIAYTIPIALAGATGVFNRELDKLITSALFIPSAVAIYMVGAREVPVLSLVAGSISDVLLPEMSKQLHAGNVERAKELWSESMRKQALVAIPAFVFLMVFATEFTVTLYGQKYSQSAGVFRIYLLVLPIRCILWSLMLSAAGVTRPLLWTSILAFACNIIVGIAAIYAWGILGAAVGTVASVLVSAGYNGLSTWRKVHVNVLSCFPWRFAGRILLLTTGAVALISAIELLPLGVEVRFAIATLAFSFLVVVGELHLNLLTPYEKMTLRKWLSIVGIGKPLRTVPLGGTDE